MKIDNIVLLGHGVGIKFLIEALIENPELGFEVVAVVTHPYSQHKPDLDMLNSRSEMYGDYGYNVFDVKLDFNIEIFETSDVNSSETISFISGYQPKYVISVACRNIIKTNFLNSFKGIVLNIHTTPLPKYRGGASDSWMILNGEWGRDLFGCMHYIDEGIDSGDIIAKYFYTVPEKCYPIQLFKVRLDTFKKLFILGLKNLSSDFFIPEKQNSEEMTVFPRLKTAIDGKIDFQKYFGDEIEKLVYAFGYPYEGAYCYFEKTRLNILEAEFFSQTSFHSICNGLIFGKDGLGNYKVAVKGGYLLIKKINVDLLEIQQKKIFRLGKFLT